MTRQHRLYKSVWCWIEDDNRLSIVGSSDREKVPFGSSTKLLDSTKKQKPTAFYFTDNVDQNQQMIFRQRYQRGIKPHIPNVVTMQDVKDTVMFLANGYVSRSFIELFCSFEINVLLRAIVLYMQLYLKVWEDLEYRSSSYKKQRLKHPISIEREIHCKTNLSKLRSRIGQEYALIIAGEGKYKKYHHMNNTLNRSYTDQDMKLYEYLSMFISKVVWIALNRINYKEIEMEVSRLFHFKDVDSGGKGNKYKVKTELKNERAILQGDEIHCLSKWYEKSPVISDIFNIEEIPGTRKKNAVVSGKSEPPRITGLQAAIKLPEEVLCMFGITLGILGQPRENFEPLLTIKQRQKSLEDELEMLNTAFVEEVKPKIKMYEYLRELNSTIVLENPEPSEGADDFIGELDLYFRSHLEDSKRSYELWKRSANLC